MAAVVEKMITAAGRDIMKGMGMTIRAANAGIDISRREWFVGWVSSIVQTTSLRLHGKSYIDVKTASLQHQHHIKTW